MSEHLDMSDWRSWRRVLRSGICATQYPPVELTGFLVPHFLIMTRRSVSRPGSGDRADKTSAGTNLINTSVRVLFRLQGGWYPFKPSAVNDRIDRMGECIIWYAPGYFMHSKLAAEIAQVGHKPHANPRFSR